MLAARRCVDRVDALREVQERVKLARDLARAEHRDRLRQREGLRQRGYRSIDASVRFLAAMLAGHDSRCKPLGDVVDCERRETGAPPACACPRCYPEGWPRVTEPERREAIADLREPLGPEDVAYLRAWSEIDPDPEHERETGSS